MEKKVRFKLSPELGDGLAHSIVSTPEQVAELVKEWCEYTMSYERVAGESFGVETVMMTDDEVKALPDF